MDNMLDVSVTLIVKAPNQQIEDQTIKCDTTWSIRRLKEVLKEVYPSKPRTEDQKLIYSGQLLPDTVILKDILRQYEGQETHTVHLVCSGSRDSTKRSIPVVSRPLPRMTDVRQDSSTTSTTVPDDDDVTNVDTSSDGLRQRLSGMNIPSSIPYQHNTNMSAPGFPTSDPRAMWTAAMAQPYPGAYDPNQMTQQLMYMQQAYAQYMTNYMQMMAANAGQNTAPMSTPLQPQPEQPPIAENQPEPQAVENPNIPDGEDEEARGNRDWLDWFYIISRLMVLFSIVYFYSSPTRFVIVTLLGAMMYLYQVGFFRAQQIQAARVVADNNNHAAGARAAAHHNLRNNQEGDVGDDNQLQEPTDPEPANEARDPPVEERPPLLAVTWTFFSTFFASLIPEQQGVQ